MNCPHLPCVCDHCSTNENGVLEPDKCPLCEIVRLRAEVADLRPRAQWFVEWKAKFDLMELRAEAAERVVEAAQWSKDGAMPPPHAKYLVRRGPCHFVATPCYGMHHPWWVPMTPEGEIEPIAWRSTDRWIALDAYREGK